MSAVRSLSSSEWGDAYENVSRSLEHSTLRSILKKKSQPSHADRALSLKLCTKQVTIASPHSPLLWDDPKSADKEAKRHFIRLTLSREEQRTILESMDYVAPNDVEAAIEALILCAWIPSKEHVSRFDRSRAKPIDHELEWDEDEKDCLPSSMVMVKVCAESALSEGIKRRRQKRKKDRIQQRRDQEARVATVHSPTARGDD